MNLDQAKQYLSSLGIDVPDFLLQAILDDIEARKECLERHYTSSQIIRLYSLMIALSVSAQGGQYISSQSLPGGLSRSFRYKDDKAMWKGLTGQLRLIDTHNCLTDLIPPDPFNTANGFLMTIRGACKK